MGAVLSLASCCVIGCCGGPGDKVYAEEHARKRSRIDLDVDADGKPLPAWKKFVAKRIDALDAYSSSKTHRRPGTVDW